MKAPNNNDYQGGEKSEWGAKIGKLNLHIIGFNKGGFKFGKINNMDIFNTEMY